MAVIDGFRHKYERIRSKAYEDFKPFAEIQAAGSYGKVYFGLSFEDESIGFSHRNVSVLIPI